jgi:hypothetical protein
MQIANDPNATPGDRAAATNIVQIESSRLPADNPISMFAAEQALTPPEPIEPDRFTLSPGQTRFSNGEEVASVPESETLSSDDRVAERKRLRIQELASRPDVINRARALNRTPLQFATDIVDTNFTVSQPDQAGRTFITDKTTQQTFQSNEGILPASLVSESMDRSRALDNLEFEAERLQDLVAEGDTFGPMNIIQRGLQRAGQFATAPLGGFFDTWFLEERLGADAINKFNQRARAAFINSDRFPVWEQQTVQGLLLQPNEISLGTGSAQVKFLELVTYIANRQEEEVAFREQRQPNRIERPRLGTDFDPLIFPEGSDIKSIVDEYPKGTFFINPANGRRMEIY